MLLVVGSARNTEQAETALNRAIEIAGTQSAKSGEFRAATRLARLARLGEGEGAAV